MNVKCPVCGAAELIHGNRDLPYTYKGETTVIPAGTADFCPACDESITDMAETERVMREMQAFNRQVNAACDEEDADLQRFMDEALADLEAELVDLSKADQERVAQALLSPLPPLPALERAFERRTRTLDDLLAMQGNEPLAIDREWDVMPAAGREQAQSPDQ
jgi:YgiT-type zinc finger domain-containing protein